MAVPPTGDLERTVELLHAMTGAESTRVLPTLRLYKIGLQLDMEGNSGAERVESGSAGYAESDRPAAGRAGLRSIDIAAIRQLQEDIPLIPEPYASMADRMGISEDALFGLAASLRSQGYLRRMAAVLYHREAGFRANAMSVWVVPPDRADEVGQIMASFKGGEPLLPSAHIPRLALQHLHHGPWAAVRGLPGNHQYHLAGDGHHGVRPPVQHEGIQEGPPEVFHP
jgi:DNA-binding Lrp family transcriptional regulator